MRPLGSIVRSYSNVLYDRMVTSERATGQRRVAVVTGGASGLGYAICRHLAAHDRLVAVLDRDAAGAETAAEALRAAGADAMAVELDVADRTAVESAFDNVRRDFGPIEVLVTSAAVSGFVPFEEITAEDWSRTIAVN